MRAWSRILTAGWLTHRCGWKPWWHICGGSHEFWWEILKCQCLFRDLYIVHACSSSSSSRNAPAGAFYEDHDRGEPEIHADQQRAEPAEQDHSRPNEGESAGNVARPLQERNAEHDLIQSFQLPPHHVVGTAALALLRLATGSGRRGLHCDGKLAATGSRRHCCCLPALQCRLPDNNLTSVFIYVPAPAITDVAILLVVVALYSTPGHGNRHACLWPVLYSHACSLVLNNGLPAYACALLSWLFAGSLPWHFLNKRWVGTWACSPLVCFSSKKTW